MDSDWNYNQCVKCDPRCEVLKGHAHDDRAQTGQGRAATNHSFTPGQISGARLDRPRLFTSEVKGTDDWASVTTTNGPSFIRDCHPTF